MFKRVLIFIFFWFLTGFTGGTLTLLGPVRGVTSILRAQGFPQASEDWAIRVIILLFVALTGWISWVISAFFLKPSRRPAKILLLLVLTTGAALSIRQWLQPKGLGGMDTASSQSRFTIGPCPVKFDFQRLKAQGYTTIVSLLHPAVVPFEPVLLKEETENAQAAGLKFLNIPMLPWLSENAEAVTKITELLGAPTKDERYYIHCYLGTDRVQIVRRLLEKFGEKVGAVGLRPARTLDEISVMERGPVRHLRDDVYLIPYPTDEEFFGYLLNGKVQTVVSLLDPSDAEARLLVEREGQMLKSYDVSLAALPMPAKATEKQMQAVVAKIRSLPHPVVVHEFRSDSPVAEAFLKAYEAAK
jgi:protein tyrosine phosphatase (PTP) superfamily phosphohydrolase (DUF442 family)